MSLLPNQELYEHCEVRSVLGKTAVIKNCDLGSVESSLGNFLKNLDEPLQDEFAMGLSSTLCMFSWQWQVYHDVRVRVVSKIKCRILRTKSLCA